MSITTDTEKRLLAIKSEFLKLKTFSVKTMSLTDDRTNEVKAMTVNLLGRDDEISMQLDLAKLILKDHINNSTESGFEIEPMRQAIGTSNSVLNYSSKN